MAGLPAGAGPSPAIGWRVDYADHIDTWDSAIGAEKQGGRWNPVGFAVVYASLDPSTAILEVAVHKGFRVLDTVAHVLTAFEVLDPHDVFIVRAEDVPNPSWLVPGTPGAGQQSFGEKLLQSHPFAAIPSAVSKHSWNLLFNPKRAAGKYKVLLQERLGIDTRLHPPHRPPP
jgi:RES domain-containing protein